MRNKICFVLVLFVSFVLALPFIFAQDYLALQGSSSGTGDASNNVIVEIWTAASGGTLLYNSSNDFNNRINNSRYDLLLGNGSQPLSLNFSGTYYMNIYLNGRDINFNGSDRQVFQSSVGNITVTTPIKTTNRLNVNDFFNVTGSTSAVSTNGSLTIRSSDPLPFGVNNAFNITNAGAITMNGSITLDTPLGIPLSINKGFNVTNSANLVTNGSITVTNNLNDAFNATGGIILAALSPTPFTVDNAGAVIARSTDTDDAVNLTSGGLVAKGQISVQNYNSAPAFTVNYGFNISGANGVMATNSTIGINTRRSNAFTINGGFNVTGALALVTNGTISLQNPSLSPSFTINNGFNISGTDESLVTNGTIRISNADTDDALNISGGLIMGQGNPGSQFKIASLVISDLNVITTQPTIAANGHIVINSLNAPALSINSGFNVSGVDEALTTNGTVTIQSVVAPAFTINKGFNISGANEYLRTNGTITILNADNDDALNISGGGFFAGNSIDWISFNPSDPNYEFSVKGLVNVSAGGVVKVANIGPNAGQCAQFAMYSTNGSLYYLWFNDTGGLKTGNAAPSNCNTVGTVIGTQS